MYGTTMRNYNANRASGTKDEKKSFFSKKSIAKENKRAKKHEDTRYMKLESSAEITANENILGKDGMQNYWYCYIFVILVFMIIIMYGTTIASGITNEKSNRSIEILVTSTSTTALLFGKVIAGVVAAVFQFGLIEANEFKHFPGAR